MRLRLSGLVLSHAAAVLLALSAVCAPAQVTPSADTSKTLAAPPVFPRRFYRAPGGQLYVPAGTPVRLSIALTQDGAQSAEATDQSSVTLKEGPNSLQFGDARIPVIADGTPPLTVLQVDDTAHVEVDGLRILGPNPKLRLSASDALSGVAETLISLDGAAFVPLPAGGAVFTAEGVHRLRYFSVDHVGNAEKLQEFVFRLDASPPQTRLEFSDPYADAVAGASSKLSLSAMDAVAGVLAIHYRLDDAVEHVYDKPLLLDDLPEGKHHLQFYSEDRVGNKERSQSFAFIVDRQPPEITLTIHGPQFQDKGVRYVSLQSEIELASVDAIAGAEPVRYRLDGADLDTFYHAPFHLPETAGVHTLRIESVDAVNNRALLNVDDIYLDLTPPQTEVEFSRPFFVRDGDVVLNPRSRIALNASDLESGVDSVTYSFDGGPEQKYSGPFSIAAEGAHRLTVSAIDHVGNREPAQELRLRIEQPANGEAPPPVLDEKRWYLHPKLGLIGPPGLPFELRIAASPDAGAENYLVSSGPVPPQGEAPVTFTVAGTNTLKVALSPKVAGFAVAIDGAPPKTQLIASGAQRIDAGGTTYFGPGLKISLASVDNSVGVSSGVWKTLYSLEGSAFKTYVAPLDAFTREGPYTLRYYALDNVGNAEEQHTFQFTIDTSPPKTRMELSGPHSANRVSPATSIVLSASDNLSGVAQIQYRIDDEKIGDYSGPITVRRLSDGPHWLRYMAVDVAGNREQVHLWHFNVVSKVGIASLEVKGKSLERGGNIFVAPGSMVRLSAAEGDSVVYTFDGSAPKPYSALIPVPPAGSHRLSFHAVDELGNVSASRNVDLIADSASPSSHLRFEGPQLAREQAVLISGATRIVLNASAGAVGGAAIEYSLNGRNWQTYTAPFTIKNSGAFDLLYRARDPLQALEPVQKQRIIVDAQGPNISVSYSVPVAANAAVLQLEPGTLMFIAAEDVPAGVQKITCKIDDQPELIYRTPLSGFTPGKTHTVVIAAEDLLGNRSEKIVHLHVREQTR